MPETIMSIQEEAAQRMRNGESKVAAQQHAEETRSIAKILRERELERLKDAEMPLNKKQEAAAKVQFDYLRMVQEQVRSGVKNAPVEKVSMQQAKNAQTAAKEVEPTVRSAPQPKLELNGKQVIIGLDVGHGECAATYFRVASGSSWNPLSLNRDKDHVIPSAIYYHEDGSISIGKTAAVNHGSVCYFKRPPALWDKFVTDEGAREGLTYKTCMRDFIRTLYQDILTYNMNEGLLEGDEIILLVGCPSSGAWLSSGAREEYEALIREATEVNYVTVVPESRGAIFNSYAGGELKGCNAAEGVAVFDFGSLTADFTYIQMGKYMLERSWDLGASSIEMAMLKRMLRGAGLTLADVYEGQLYDLLYFLRQQKEMYFSGEMGMYADPSVTLYEVDEDGERIQTGVTKRGTPKFAARRVGLPDADLDEFMEGVTGEETITVVENGEVLGQFDWESACEAFFATMKDMLDARGLPCKAVVLTGGATKMPFITEIAQRVFAEVLVVREKNPSITVARGLSIIGDTDLRAPMLLDGLSVQMEQEGMKLYDELVNLGGAEPMAKKAFSLMMDYLGTIDHDITVGELKNGLTARMKEEFTESYVCLVLDSGMEMWTQRIIARITEETNAKVEELYHGHIDTEGFMLDVGFVRDVFSSSSHFALDSNALLENVDLAGIAVQVISAVLSVIVIAIVIILLEVITFGFGLLLGVVVELAREIIVDLYARNENRVLSKNQIDTIIRTLNKPEKQKKQIENLKTMFVKQLRTSYNADPNTELQLRKTLQEAADRAFGIISLKYFAVESIEEK